MARTRLGADKPSDAEWTFRCERCNAAKQTHLIEVSEDDLISCARLCDRCLRLEYNRHLEQPRGRRA